SRATNSKRGGAILTRATSRLAGTTETVGAVSERSPDGYSTSHMAATLATPIARGADLLLREARTARPLQRLGARHRLGCADARGDNCDFHVHLRRHLRRALRRQ